MSSRCLQKGRTEDRTEGERLATARILILILQMRFSESFTQEDQHRIMALCDAELLNALILRAAAAADYAEIQKLLK